MPTRQRLLSILFLFFTNFSLYSINQLFLKVNRQNKSIRKAEYLFFVEEKRKFLKRKGPYPFGDIPRLSQNRLTSRLGRFSDSRRLFSLMDTKPCRRQQRLPFPPTCGLCNIKPVEPVPIMMTSSSIRFTSEKKRPHQKDAAASRCFHSVYSNASFPAPQSGHVKLSETSSHLVPGAIPCSGQPNASS